LRLALVVDGIFVGKRGRKGKRGGPRNRLILTGRAINGETPQSPTDASKDCALKKKGRRKGRGGGGKRRKKEKGAS